MFSLPTPPRIFLTVNFCQDNHPSFARFEQLAYKFTPEDNPLEDFDKDFKAKKYSYKEDENPFKDFSGYGFST